MSHPRGMDGATAPNSQQVAIVRDLINAAIARDSDRLHDANLRLQQHGEAGFWTLVYSCCDTLIGLSAQLQGVDPGPDVPTAPAWLDRDGLHTDADEMDPLNRFVGRLVAARAAEDCDTCWALVHAIPEPEFGLHVAALIEATAQTIRVFAGPGARCAGLAHPAPRTPERDTTTPAPTGDLS